MNTRNHIFKPADLTRVRLRFYLQQGGSEITNITPYKLCTSKKNSRMENF